MRGVPRGLSIVALAALFVLVGGLAQAVHTAPHDHGGPGLYDPGCPLVMLAAVERQGTALGVSDGPPPITVTGLAVLARVEAPSAPAAVDLRLRAPPRR